MNMNTKIQSKTRSMRTRRKIRLVSDRPRLSVFRSNKHLYAQVIDDKKGETLSSVSDKQLEKHTGSKTELAHKLGLLLAKKSKDMKITKVVFDKGRFSYHGQIKSFADGAREGGLEF